MYTSFLLPSSQPNKLSKDYLTTETTHAGNFKVGLYHGHQSIPLADPEILSALGTQLGVDVLITGGTHVSLSKLFSSFQKSSVSEHNGILLLNPGSTTGAYSAYAV
jgi:vacuolar protein sorting-associated protein 29